MRRTLLTVAAFLCLAAPAQAKNFYGVVWDRDVAEAADSVQDKQFALMRATGVQTARTVFSWNAAQPANDQPPSFARTDQLMARAARNGIELLPIVMYAPPWARQHPDRDASPPARPDDYVAYLRALVGRYGPSGSFWSEHPDVPKRPQRIWQVWNEPQLPYQWAAAGWQQGYGELLAPSYAALKQADPGSRVVLAGATNFAWDALESMYAKGDVKGHFDVAALHPYTGSAGRVLQVAKLFRGVLKKHGEAKKPVWITELAWPASKGRVKPPAGLKELPTTDKGMALRLTRAYKLLAKTKVVQRAYWYTWASAYRSSDGIFGFTGLLRYDGKEFTPAPALRAYRQVAR
jgi:hypothetical protein